MFYTVAANSFKSQAKDDSITHFKGFGKCIKDDQFPDVRDKWSIEFIQFTGNPDDG